MLHTLRSIESVYRLPAASLTRLTDQMELIQEKKGKVLIKAHRPETCIWWLEQGIARAFYYQRDRDITFWFGKEGDIVVSYNSYINQQAGYENIELLEDAILYRLNHQTLFELYAQDVHLANWGRKLAEGLLIETEKRLIRQLFDTATDKYRYLVQTQPELLHRVKLSYIASYLGVSQVTLSRIRNKWG